MPRPAPAPTPGRYRLIATATAAKIGPRSLGAITCQLMADLGGQELFIAIVGNAAGGNWSREPVPLARIEACLADLAQDQPFSSRRLGGRLPRPQHQQPAVPRRRPAPPRPDRARPGRPVPAPPRRRLGRPGRPLARPGR